MKKIKKLILWCWNNDVLRYIFFGGCTTLVNLGCYYALRLATEINMNVANTISVAIAILFAYAVNSRFVFRSKADGFKQHLNEFVKFVGARMSTMVIEVGGVWFMADVLKINDLIAKFVIQFIILVLNYIFSKFLVFTKKKGQGEEK